jgi:hypothetical protein
MMRHRRRAEVGGLKGVVGPRIARVKEAEEVDHQRPRQRLELRDGA